MKSLCVCHSRIIGMTWWQQQQECQNSSKLNRSNNNSAYAANFFVYFIPPNAWLQHGNMYMQFHTVWRTWTSKCKAFLLLLNLDMVLTNLTPGEFTCIWPNKWFGMIAIETHGRNMNSLFAECFHSHHFCGILNFLIPVTVTAHACYSQLWLLCLAGQWQIL